MKAKTLFIIAGVILASNILIDSIYDYVVTPIKSDIAIDSLNGGHAERAEQNLISDAYIIKNFIVMTAVLSLSGIGMRKIWRSQIEEFKEEV